MHKFTRSVLVSLGLATLAHKELLDTFELLKEEKNDRG